MRQNSFPCTTQFSNVNTDGHLSWPKAIVTIVALLLGIAVFVVGGSLVARYELFDTLRGDAYGFFYQTMGMDKPTASALGIGLGLIAMGVLWKSFWSLILGRATGTLMVVAGIGLLGYWGLTKYGTAPMTPSGKANQNYAVIDGQCQFFDHGTPIDPRTGKNLFPVTEKVLEACANRKSGKAPKEVDAANPANVEWFDRVLGHPAVYYVKRFNGQLVFFDAPGTDPMTGQPLEAVTSEVVQAVVAKGSGTSPLARTSASGARTSNYHSENEPLQSAISGHPSGLDQPAESGGATFVSKPAAPALTREAVMLVGEAKKHGQVLIERLHRDGVIHHAVRLPESVAWPATGAPDAAALAAARMLGIRSVAVLSLRNDVKTSPELAGFTHVTTSLITRVFDTQSGLMTESNQSHAEGRAFDPSNAIAQAVAQLGS